MSGKRPDDRNLRTTDDSVFHVIKHNFLSTKLSTFTITMCQSRDAQFEKSKQVVSAMLLS